VVLLTGAAAGVLVRDPALARRLGSWIGIGPGPTSDEVLEAHRRSQTAETALAPLLLTDDRPDDFPGYRGRARDGLVPGPPLARDWKTHAPHLLWRQPVGGGFGAFAVAGNGAVTLEQRRDEEAVVCYDTATGRERWLYAYPAHFREPRGDGPRATPTVADGDVFSLGATGLLTCLEGTMGRLRWSVDTLAGNDNLTWGMSGSPLVYDDVVVVSPGVQQPTAAGRAVVAYERRTGREVWHAGDARAGYSSPMLTSLAGRRQVVVFDGDGLAGYDAARGTPLWRFPWQTQQGVNAAQPVVLDGDRVFISSGYNTGCAMLRVSVSADKWAVKPLWQNRALCCKFTSPVTYQGFLYGLDEGILTCLDERSGERKWKGGRYGHGQLLLTAGLLLIVTDTGELALVEATAEGHHELGQFPVLEGKTWNPPALAGGRVYVRNDREMACYNLTE
jgi:outer membrane protein assembly factor BamB